MKAPIQRFIKSLYILGWGERKIPPFLRKGKSLTQSVLLFTHVLILHNKIFTLKCISFQKTG